MKETDKDMILMLHEFEYELNEKKHFLRSSLVVKGENSIENCNGENGGTSTWNCI